MYVNWGINPSLYCDLQLQVELQEAVSTSPSSKVVTYRTFSPAQSSMYSCIDFFICVYTLNYVLI